MSIQPRTAKVTIYQGDYLDRIHHLERKFEAAREAESDAPRTLDEVPESHDIAEEHAALVKEAEESALHVKLAVVRRSVYRELTEKHPPREGFKGDENIGANALTLREDLVPAAIVEVIEGDTAREWSDFSDRERDDFLDSLAESDFERLFVTAYGLVNGFAAGPKALRLSQETQESDETAN